jgi:cell wall-associated NlpC family hydrolase
VSERERIEQLIGEVAQRFADRRRQHFDVKVLSAGHDRVALGGEVLEPENLDMLREAIQSRYPAMSVSDSEIRVLRSGAKLHFVATNLTDLHKGPSFLEEMLTQVTYGAAVNVLTEQDRWCLVEQAGYLGWAYKPYLAEAPPPQATHIVAGTVLPVFRGLDASTPPVTRLLGGTRVTIIETMAPWAHVDFAGGKIPHGWVNASELRPIESLPFNLADARRQMISDARRLTGVCYLWGGGSAFGVDCSGLAQLVHRLSGYEIPRDADMQFDAGQPVERDFRPGDLLFFSGEHNRRKISHVGISTGGWKMIHSSRFHNGVYEDDVQTRPHLRDTFAGARTFLNKD